MQRHVVSDDIATYRTEPDPLCQCCDQVRSTCEAALSGDEEDLLRQVAEGKPIKAIAVSRQTTPEAINAGLEKLFIKLAEGLSAGKAGSLERIKKLHRAIIDREEQGETLARLLPGGVAEKLRREGKRIGENEELVVTVLMGDIRGYTPIAERTSTDSAAFSPDGSTLVTVENGSGDILVWALSDARRATAISGEHSTSVHVNPDQIAGLLD